MTWWIWILIGLGLLALEAASPGGLFAAFFGLSGLVVGGLVALGWANTFVVQGLLFAAIAVAFLVGLRGPLKGRLNLGVQKAVDNIVGETAIVIEDVPAGGVGKAELRGSAWSARSTAGEALVKGRRCRVDRVDGLTLWIRSES